LTTARTCFRSSTASASAAVVLNATFSPVAMPFVSLAVHVKCVWTSMAGKRGVATFVSLT
jgi:hypothetical protein